MQDTATAVVPDCPLSAPSGGVRGSVGGGSVSLASGKVLPYDWLVLSLGATARLELVPGAREHAIPFLTLEDVTRVQTALSNAQAAAGGRDVTVAVVGAALAGVELAAAVASVVGKQGGRVVLLAGGPTVMAENTDTQRSAAEAALARAGVEVVPSRRVASITPADASGEVAACGYSIHFQAASSGSEPPPPLAADVVLWTAGQRPAGKELLGPEWLDAALGGISTDTCLRVRCVSHACYCCSNTHLCVLTRLGWVVVCVSAAATSGCSPWETARQCLPTAPPASGPATAPPRRWRFNKRTTAPGMWPLPSTAALSCRSGTST